MTETTETFTDEERAAMKERSKELRTASKRAGSAAEKQAAAEKDLLEKISEMSGTDRAIAEKLHEIVATAAPELVAKTWYGMPGYAKDGKVVVFFQAAAKFKVRYATIGFNETAALDDGDIWPTAFAVTALTPAVEKQIAALVAKAAG
ncbi:iron chaperone [Amnibacterium flavum]|uniref:YdhG-like domain-containing protein n=1 Tax=Amnibacterium flavum TaxID=2173173 RepID=A0A2V1HPV8_9MICO|nr:DUF1801 domain-containing protein [Amnibacterium flavum]PVZ94636.1 hypothetical protein DDQ50_13160 [Amnibacterium flavum]